MELIYLWVKNYKNIYHQNFNFSPRFKCEYAEDTNELTIDENKNYINIFPENINITAIVGENGSGKSSILDCILDSIAYHDANNLILFESNNKLYCNKKCNLKCDPKIEIEFFESDGILGKKNRFLEVCTHTSDFLNSDLFFNRNLDIYLDVHPMAIHETPIDRSLNDMHHLLKLELEKVMYLIQKLSLSNILKNTSEFFSAQKYQISFNKDRLIYILFDIVLYGEGKDEVLKKQVEEYIENIISNKDLEHIIDFYFFITRFERSSNKYSTLRLNIKNNSFLELAIPTLLKEETIKKKHFLNLLKEVDKVNNFNEEDKEKFKNIIENDDIFSIFLDLFDINLKEGEKYFSDLSYGERDLLLIEGLISNTTNKNALFLFDEIALSYHPNWSKEFMNKLLTTTNKNIHIVIASHSPFILSDLPKENVIFLEKNENGNCKNVSNSIEIEQTFGANIHTLLSHGFFMKDGLMGEFAKGKINEVYDFLTDSNNQNELTQEKAQNIINLIGEPILKKELQALYDKKFEINNIDKKIRKYQEEIKKLEAQRDTNDKA